MRSGREHWAWMVVVEVLREHCASRVAVEDEGERRGKEKRRGDERRREEEKATNVKSNNPHLADGEKPKCQLPDAL